jgi:hypothetical protein
MGIKPPSAHGQTGVKIMGRAVTLVSAMHAAQRARMRQ